MRELGDPVDEIWGDESVRQSYNFAPGYTGLVYRAATTNVAAGSQHNDEQSNEAANAPTGSNDGIKTGSRRSTSKNLTEDANLKYVLQAMKWGVCVRYFMNNNFTSLKLRQRSNGETCRSCSILDETKTTIRLSHENNQLS